MATTMFKPWRTYAPLKAQQHPPAPTPPRRYCDADDCPCAEDGRCPACGNIGRVLR